MAPIAITDLFEESWYLRRYPDVAAAVQAGEIDARTHFQLYGKQEGRAPGPLFIPDYYLSKNADVAAAVEQGLITAYDHFLNYGMAEGRSPVAYFDAAFYVKQNPDVAAAAESGAVSAIEHFLLYGMAEGRNPVPWFNSQSYLATNPDVNNNWAAAAFQHLLLFGVFEDRDLGNGIRMEFFRYDPIFNAAMGASAFHDAVARLGAVAPFFPNFTPPPGWEAAPDTPIPIDFIPPPGMKLVVPPSVIIPDGMILPDTFEPVNPPGPKPDPDPGPSPDPDCGCDDPGTVCLEDGDRHDVEPADQRFIIFADALQESVIKINGYETYQPAAPHNPVVFDLSKVQNLHVYDAHGVQGLTLKYGEHTDAGGWKWDDSGENLVVSMSKELGHIELTGSAGQIVNFRVGNDARSFGYNSLRIDIEDALKLICGCEEGEPLSGEPGTLLLGAVGMQTFVIGTDNMAMGGPGQDVFVLHSPDGWHHGPAIIGDYSFDELDIIELGSGSLDEVDLLDFSDFLALELKASSSKLTPESGLVEAGGGNGIDVYYDGTLVLHASNFGSTDGAVKDSVVFTKGLGLITATFNINDGSVIDSLFSKGAEKETFFPYFFFADEEDEILEDLDLPELDDCGCGDEILGFAELLVGGGEGHTINAGQTFISVLMGGGGDDTLTGYMLFDRYYGGPGNDTISLVENKKGNGVVIFGSDAQDNGKDIITNFTAGCAGDMLDFSLFLNPDAKLEDILNNLMMMSEGFETTGGPDSDGSDTGNEQIIIVGSTVDIDEGFVGDLGDENRYVVLKSAEAGQKYEIFFIDKDLENPIGKVATLELDLVGALCECNFLPQGV